VRLFDPTSHGTTALTFRRYGPLLRFDHHRALLDKSGIRQPCPDPDRSVYYAAKTLSGCIVEIFGDTGIITAANWHVALPVVTQELRLLNLRGRGAMRAGSVAALAKVPDHALSQQWSVYFYETPAYRNIDGLIYYNAHNDEEAILLYERAERALDCPPSNIIRLNDSALRPALLKIAQRNNLRCSP
jgi:RES domain